MTIKPKALKAIHTATVSAGSVAAVPIPFSDAALLVPIQMMMISSIYKAYGLTFTDGIKEGVTQATLASTIGKMLVGNAFKFIPGIGSVAGGVLNVTVAASITRMIGMRVAKALDKGELETNNDLLELIATVSNVSSVLKKK
ncbi:GTPase [Vagococcus zengguangii]|uniref:GTPase n=1 Tax=Vagococcus zengguangii TaxID=2571750 RepID=A0A4D7CTL9_9ENTE|nr:GTPase [Vagococcus zengguangii]QCI86232.1 GTPase [Vagococcus zengguangii]TLG79659.1 GTPase [Vagococcus zengguangii]